MSEKSRFLGKIRQDPGEALARGPREVMETIWREYLQEVLEVSQKSGRYRILRVAIEAAGDFPQAYREWNDWPPATRSQTWRRLIAAARAEIESRGNVCVRCGECCEKSSPTLLVADLPLLEQEVISFGDVYTLRAGEKGTGRDGTVMDLSAERLKVREVPGTRQCWFYRAPDQTCRIYDQRPEQCRRQQCWGEEAIEPTPEEFLNRRHLFARVPEMWDLIQAHEKRCGLKAVRQGLAGLAEGREEAAEPLFEALHFDHYLRQMLVDDWGLSPLTTELLLGRPIKNVVQDFGYRAVLTPEGVFRLELMEKV
jgi:Fe-S-cluster containining protein